jgi:predicted metal-dependent enzyme (double-stranded beta helix superfamily)
VTLDPQQPQNLHAAIAATRSQISALSALEAQFTDLLNRMNAAAAAADAAEERARVAEQRLASLEAKIQVAQQVLSEAQLKMYEAVASVAGLLNGDATLAPAPAPMPAAMPAPVRPAAAPAAPIPTAVPVAVPEPPREVYRLTQFAHDLRVIAAESKTQGELLRRTKPLVQELVINKEWLRPEHFHIDEVQGFTATCLHEEPNHDLAIFAVAFAPGKGAPPHDHGTWAVVGVVEGEEQNTFWKRVDDGTRPGYAELKRAAVNTFRAGDVATFTPELIHSLDNVTDKISLSLHVYGRHLNHASRSKFDPDTSTVEPFVVRVAGSSNGAPAPAPVAAAAAPQHAPSTRPSRPLFRRPPAASPTIPPIIAAPTRFDRFVQELRVIVAEAKTEMEILRRAQPLVKEIAKSKEWLRPEHYHIDPVQGFTATCLHEEPNHDLGIFAVAFAPGKGAPPHDHGTWAVVSVVDGVEQNTMWKRVDDRSRPGYAEIRAVSVKNFQADDCAIFTSDLIHSLDNLGDRVSLSFHVYGRHLNHAARFKFDANARTVEPFIVNVAN